MTDQSKGQEIYDLAQRIFPICRSITGPGVRATLDILSRHLPLEQKNVATGTRVLDWTVPHEWHMTDAYIMNDRNERVVDFQKHTLHVVNYSVPVRQRMSPSQLREYVHTLPDKPDAIPYRTSFYKETWGFCMSHRTWLEIEAAGGEYEVCIDSRLKPGSLTWGEFFHQGRTTDEVLLSTHICHPSLANDNCSGLAVLTALGQAIMRRSTRLSYRLIFIPATIGSITWLASNEAGLANIKHGLTIANAGDPGGPTYKRSRRGNAIIDRAAAHVLQGACPNARVMDFIPYGYDERQFCSPGFDLPMGAFQRSSFGTFPQYHTSDDNMSFITPEALGRSLDWLLDIIDVLENERTVINLFPKGEPHLSKHGLYSGFGKGATAHQRDLAVLWVLNLSDGRHSLLDIAERSSMPFRLISEAAQALEACGLVAPVRD